MGPVVPLEIVRLAAKDPQLLGRVVLSSSRRIALLDGDQIGGFVTPHRGHWGWRAGPIYVLPEFRGRGLVDAFYAAHTDRTWIAFVATSNVASRRMHERNGFVRWRKSPYGVWLRRESI